MKALGRKIPFEWELVWWTLWYGARERFDWLRHRLRYPSHDMYWRGNEDPPTCSGDMGCRTCDIVFGCRGGNWQNAIGQILCPYFGGHFSSDLATGGWEQSIGWDEVKDEPIYVPVGPPQPPFCMRCFAKVSPHTESA